MCNVGIDFEYDGRRLSDYGFIICTFDKQSGFDITDSGAKITFTRIPRHGGRKHNLVSSKYEETVTATIEICKDEHTDINGDYEISESEYREMTRWLNRRDFHKFFLVGNIEDGNAEYFNASFNVEKIKLDNRIYGIRLTMETDSPYAYGETVVETHQFSANDSYIIKDISDMIGYLPINMVVTCGEAGTLNISNDATAQLLSVKNCTSGEVLTIDSENQTIQVSSGVHLKLANDFNYQFLDICNELDDRDNEITVSMDCTIKFSYTPIVLDWV